MAGNEFTARAQARSRNSGLGALFGLLVISPLSAAAQNPPDICYRAVDLQRQADWPAAAEATTQCIESDSLNRHDLQVAHHNRGLVYAYLGVVEADNEGDALEYIDLAILDLAKAIELDPNDGLAYCVRGTVYLTLCDWYWQEEDCEKGHADVQRGRELGETDDFWCALPD